MVLPDIVKQQAQTSGLKYTASDTENLKKVLGWVRNNKLLIASNSLDLLHERKSWVTQTPPPPWLSSTRQLRANTLTTTQPVLHITPLSRHWAVPVLQKFPVTWYAQGNLAAWRSVVASVAGSVPGTLAKKVFWVTLIIKMHQSNRVFFFFHITEYRSPGRAFLAL